MQGLGFKVGLCFVTRSQAVRDRTLRYPDHAPTDDFSKNPWFLEENFGEFKGICIHICLSIGAGGYRVPHPLLLGWRLRGSG